VVIPALFFGAVWRLSNGLGRRAVVFRVNSSGILTTFAPEVELLLRDFATWRRPPKWKIILSIGITPNDALEDIYIRTEAHLKIIGQRSSTPEFMFWFFIWRLNRSTSRGLRAKAQSTTYDRTMLWLEPARLNPSPDNAMLRRLGVQARKFVVVSSKQGAYYSWRLTQPLFPRQVKDLRSNTTRINNVPITQTALAAQELRLRGFDVLRMGRVLEEPTPESMIAVQPWSAAADLVVFSSAALHLCGATGTWALSAIFNQRVLIHDVYEFSARNTEYPRAWFILQQLHDRASGKTLSVEESLDVSDGRPWRLAEQDPRFSLCLNDPKLIARAANFVLDLDTDDPLKWPQPSLRERRLLETFLRRPYKPGNTPRVYLEDA
jgi:hypothetical protein